MFITYILYISYLQLGYDISLYIDYYCHLSPTWVAPTRLRLVRTEITCLICLDCCACEWSIQLSIDLSIYIYLSSSIYPSKWSFKSKFQSKLHHNPIEIKSNLVVSHYLHPSSSIHLHDVQASNKWPVQGQSLEAFVVTAGFWRPQLVVRRTVRRCPLFPLTEWPLPGGDGSSLRRIP